MHLRVDPGATVIAAGATDPFIDSFSMGVRHVDIINNSTESFIIDSSLAVDVVSVQGVGNTVIGAGASMTADAVAQNALEVAV